MKCPVCESSENKISNTRADGPLRWRLRKCLDCRFSFKTYEIQADEYEEVKSRIEQYREDIEL